MTREVTSQLVIELPRTEAWEKLKDLSRAHDYVPGIVKTTIVSDRTEGVGASRYVYRNAKSYIQETVVEWNEGHGFLIRLHKGDKPAPPFRNAWFRYDLADHDQGNTLFTASLGYEMPWGVVGAWLGKKLEKIVAASVADVASATKLYYETGEPTTAKALKDYKTSVKGKR